MQLSESTLSKLIGTATGGQSLVSALHKEHGLGNDAEFDPIDKISWSWFKANRNNFAVLTGPSGSAAIKSVMGDNYEVVTANSAGEISKTTQSRGGNALEFIKDKIGKTRKIYVAKQAVELDKIQQRNRQRQGTETGYSPEALLKKLRPMISRYTERAAADVQGMAIQMIKAGNYGGAGKKLDRLQRLESIKTLLDVSDKSKINWGGREIANLSGVLDRAVKAAYGEMYPDAIRQGTDWRGRLTSEIEFANSTQFKEFTNKLAQGDQKMLGMTMAYFKQMIAAGG